MPRVKIFASAQSYYQNHFKQYCSRVTECVRIQMTWSDAQLMRDIFFMLGSEGWEKAAEAVSRLVTRSEIPWQGASANTDVIVGELMAIVQYVLHFISVPTLDYRAVWWRLYHAPNASEWTDVLTLATLLFSLPASNAKLERVFSQVKANKRTLLVNDTLYDLLLVTSQNFPVMEFCADSARPKTTKGLAKTKYLA